MWVLNYGINLTMKISASIGSWTGDLQANIETLRSIDVDRVHIDVFDDLDDVPHIDFKNSPYPCGNSHRFEQT